jgi:AhpD family alkylhydroperoxidase
MSRIEPVDYSGAEGRPKELLDAVNGLLGATPNMTTTMARSAVLDGWLGLSGALRKGSISAANGERIALGVAEANECAYCLSVHSYLGANVVKLDPEELEQARRFQSSDPKVAAILAFAEAVVRTKGGVSDSDGQAAREAGLTDAELSDVVGHVAVNVLTNYFNRAFDVELDFPLVEPHQHVTAG